jgi:hypothetical protein
MLYTWDDPSKERSLLWNVYNKKSKGFVAEFWKVRIISLQTLHRQFSQTCYLLLMAGYATQMENKMNACKILVKKHLKSGSLKDRGDENIMLRWILWKYVVRKGSGWSFDICVLDLWVLLPEN